MESRHLQGYSPRLSQLRTDGLAPVSKYWTYWSHTGVYGPSNPSNLPSTEGGFAPTASLAGSGEKLSMDIRISQPSCWGLCWEPFLIRNSGSVRRCWRWCERLLYVNHVRYVWSWTIRGLSMESVWRVGQGFPCRVYIDSNHRDSQIWETACLWQSSRR
jgi:hypothetical protein